MRYDHSPKKQESKIKFNAICIDAIQNSRKVNEDVSILKRMDIRNITEILDPSEIESLAKKLAKLRFADSLES